MHRKLFAHRILLASAALGMLACACAGTAWADEQRLNFNAVSETEVTSAGVPFEKPLIAEIDGKSPQFGKFTGSFVSNLVGEGQAGVGVATLQFDGGTLMLRIPNALGPNFEGHGGWKVIGGDGVFDGVVGGGELDYFVTGQTDADLPIFLVFLEGTLTMLED